MHCIGTGIVERVVVRAGEKYNWMEKGKPRLTGREKNSLCRLGRWITKKPVSHDSFWSRSICHVFQGFEYFKTIFCTGNSFSSGILE